MDEKQKQNKTHYVAHVYRDGQEELSCRIDDKDYAMHHMMQYLFNALGNGDGENGGNGSLWRCAKGIYDAIASGARYSYADMEFWLETVEPVSYKWACDDPAFNYDKAVTFRSSRECYGQMAAAALKFVAEGVKSFDFGRKEGDGYGTYILVFDRDAVGVEFADRNGNRSAVTRFNMVKF